MLRVFSLCALLCLSTAAMAEDAAVDAVLKTGNAVSEDQLDATAETLISQQEADQAKAVVKPVAAKVLTEAQIPVFKEEKSVKPPTASPWMRLIGSGVFVLMMAVGLFVAAKKMSKRKNIIGKKAKIDIIHQHFLGPKKSIALIQVAGETILIGITDHNINMIKPVALIDDEVAGQPQDFHDFLEDEFAVENLAPKKTRARYL